MILRALLFVLLVFIGPAEAKKCGIDFKEGLKAAPSLTSSSWQKIKDRILTSADLAAAEYYAIIPTGEEAFKRTFRNAHTPNSANLRAMQRAAEKATKNNIKVLSDSSVSSDQLMSMIRASKKKIVVVAGHNENGMLMLPDNTSISMAKLLGQMESSPGKLIIIVSCNTKSHFPYIKGATDRAISMDDGLSMVIGYQEKARRFAAENGTTTYSKFIDASDGGRRIIVTQRTTQGELQYLVRVISKGGAVIVTIEAAPCLSADGSSCKGSSENASSR